MTSELDMLRLKARAFDNLMKVMDGQHCKVDHYRRPKPSKLPPIGELSKDAVLKVEDIYIYEWKIRVANHTDLKRLCLDNAKKDLEKEERNANTSQPGL